jgi:hypothetical protein
MFGSWRTVDGEGRFVWRIHGAGAFEVLEEGRLAAMVCGPVGCEIFFWRCVSAFVYWPYESLLRVNCFCISKGL